MRNWRIQSAQSPYNTFVCEFFFRQIEFFFRQIEFFFRQILIYSLRWDPIVYRLIDASLIWNFFNCPFLL